MINIRPRECRAEDHSHKAGSKRDPDTVIVVMVVTVISAVSIIAGISPISPISIIGRIADRGATTIDDGTTTIAVPAAVASAVAALIAMASAAMPSPAMRLAAMTLGKSLVWRGDQQTP